MKKTLIWGILAILIAAAIVVAVVVRKPAPVVENPPITKTNLETLQGFAVFSQPLPNVQNIGFANFSPDGHYFAYSVFSPVSNPANRGYVVDLKTGANNAVGGMLSRGFRDNNFLTLFKIGGSPAVYNADTGAEIALQTGENTRDAFVSSDGKRAVVSGEGVVIINLQNGEKKVLDAKPESAGYAWFSDNMRVLGFKENTENLFEAGKGRDLGIWNADTGAFTKLPITFKVKSIRYVEWLVPDRVARMNAGYDDGSYDYLVDVTTNKLIDLGETSWALMGGIVTDSKLGVMAAIGSGGAGDCVKYRECDGFIADATGKIAEFKLPRDFHRSGLQIISKTKLLYIRRDLGEEGGYGTTKLVTYDTVTKTETVIKEDIPNMNIVTLALSPDKKIWVVGAGDRFMVGELK